MIDLKLDEVPQRIKEFEADGDFELAKKIKQEYEYAKIAFEGLTFHELLLVFYVRCCYRNRLQHYLAMAKEEALFTQKQLEFVEDWKKRCNKSGADNV